MNWVLSFLGYTPLHLASYCGQSQVFEFLINCQVDIGAKTNHGETAIHLACINGHLEIVKQYAFLTKKEERAKGDAYGYYPIHFAAAGGFDEVIIINLYKKRNLFLTTNY